MSGVSRRCLWMWQAVALLALITVCAFILEELFRQRPELRLDMCATKHQIGHTLVFPHVEIGTVSVRFGHTANLLYNRGKIYVDPRGRRARK